MRNRRLNLSLLLLLLPFALQAQSRLSLSEAEQMIPRVSRQGIRSLIPSEHINPIDTIATGNSAMKIIFYEDGTWVYWKDGSVVGESEVFTRNWDNTKMDPYGVNWSDVPDCEYVWMLDETTNHYHYPGRDSISISSRFGYRHGVRHTGIDIRMPRGESIYAAFDGKVRINKYVRGYGNLIVLRHENGMETFYAHLTKSNVKLNDWVEAGQIIGTAGSSGRATGPHLHFEVRYKGYALDPEWVINFEDGSLRHRVLAVKKSYLNAGSKYFPESEEEEEKILMGDEEARLEAERREAELKAAKYVTIKSGDTLSRIAKANGTTVSKLCQLNNMTTRTILRVGKKIRVR